MTRDKWDFPAGKTRAARLAYNDGLAIAEFCPSPYATAVNSAVRELLSFSQLLVNL
jgi:hypothetical protein